MTGSLVLAATPIGDVEDASPRLRRLLVEAEVVAAEDTRRLLALAARLELRVAGRIVSYHHLHGDDRLTRAQLAPAVDHRAAQRAVAIEMGRKHEVPVKTGGQFRTLQAGAEQKSVGPARRDRRGAQALLSPWLSQ